MNKELKPEQVTALIDNREKIILDLSPLKQIPATLTTGDVSILGLEHKVAVERKTLADLIGCVTSSRERFEREIMRMQAYEHRAIFVQGSIAQIEMKQYRSQASPLSIIGSINSWMSKNIPIMFCENHQQMGLMISRYLYVIAKHHWRSVYSFIEAQTVAQSSDNELQKIS